MTKISHFSLLLLCLASLAAEAGADTITLKSGERIEARISAETETNMTLQIQVSAGITDERIISKADILKVDRIAEDETAFRAIMNLQPGKNSLQPARYEPIISALQAFATKYPASPHRPAVLATMDAFTGEQKRVSKGEIKFEGRWLSKDEAMTQRIQIGGNQAFLAMKSASASGDAIGALNAFAVLEKNFPGARVMPDAIQQAQQILSALPPAITRALENQKVIKAEREQGFANAGPVNRKELMAAYQREQAQADATLAAATAAGQWPPLIAGSEKCLLAIQTKIPTEAKRLEGLPVAAMRDSISLVERAETEYAARNSAAALETLREATALWSANNLATLLQAQIMSLKTPPKLDPTTNPAATPPVTAAATPAGKNPAATPKPSANATPAPLPPPGGTATAEAKPAEPKPFFMTLSGAITIVVVLALLLAGANIFNHIRQRREDAQE